MAEEVEVEVEVEVEEEEEFGCAENQNHLLFKRHQTHHSDYILNAMTAQKNDGFFAGERPGNRDPGGESAHPAAEFSPPVSWDAFFRVNNMVGSSELVFQQGVTEQLLVGREVAAEVRNLAAETESDEFDCESEEGQEAVEELTKSAAPPPATYSSSRNGSKRSRAAEVHNLSEKRRRSRINEKMKALQNLIPNANKTDKASMLDEAIEYLKQLQLQVQMLSMKSGLYLPHMYMSAALQQFQVPPMCVDFGTTANSSLPVNMAAGLMPINQNASSLLFPQCTSSLQSQAAIGTTASDVIPSTLCIDSSQPHLRPYGFPMASEEIYRANVSSHEGLDIVRNIDITATKTQHLLMKDVDNLRASN